MTRLTCLFLLVAGLVINYLLGLALVRCLEWLVWLMVQ